MKKNYRVAKVIEKNEQVIHLWVKLIQMIPHELDKFCWQLMTLSNLVCDELWNKHLKALVQ